MKCDELQYERLGDANKTYPASTLVIRKQFVDAAIAELKDKCQMHDFFWEGCGFAKRGFKNSIAVSEAFDKLEAENAELKKKLMPCLNGDCILTCEVVEKYGKENAELKAKLENAQAKVYADSIDARKRERRLRRALWLARAERAKEMAKGYNAVVEWFIHSRWIEVERKCLKKAEEYK